MNIAIGSGADLELLALFKSSDSDTKKAVIAALKGENAQNANPMAAMMSMSGGMMAVPETTGNRSQYWAPGPVSSHVSHTDRKLM